MFSNANHKFSLADDGSVQSRPATQQEIDAARSSWTPALRSCWNCNHAHIHFLNDPVGHSFVCHTCGRFYSDGVDVTDYPEAEERNGAKP